jgi:DNA-binding transcriptional LysR family regulator
MLDPRRLRALREVARQRSFRGAAEALGYSQSAVSQHVAALERDVGAVLIDRSDHRAIAATEAGARVLRHAERILAAIDDGEAEVRALADGPTRPLRLGAFSSACATFVPDVVVALRRRDPAVAVDLIRSEPEDAVRAVSRRELDLAVVVAPLDGPPEGVELVRLWADPLHVALPARHRLAREPGPLGIAELADERWIQCDEHLCPDTQLLRRLLGRTGEVGEVGCTGTDYLVIQGLVAAGGGVSLLPELALRYRRADVVVRPLRERPVRTIGVALPTAGRAAAAGAVVDALRAAAP